MLPYHRKLLSSVQQGSNLDISGASYSGNSLANPNVNASLSDVFISPDGTDIYFCMAGAGTANDEIHQYTLSTAGDLSTASATHVMEYGSFDSNPSGLAFSPDGTKMFVYGIDGGTVREFSLSPAWDLSSASSNGTASLSQGSLQRGIDLSPDGSKLFHVSRDDRKIYQYGMSTPFDVSTLSYDNKNADVSSEFASQDFFIRTSYQGNKLAIGHDDGNVYQYSLSDPNDIETLSYDSITFNPSEGGAVKGLTFTEENDKMFLITSGTIFEYDL